ncbi:MAG: helix-turn-helix transcriptional regulator [Pseudomonadota bacterium]
MLYPIQTPNQLAAHLRALRLSKKLTQAQLATKLGLSQTRVARIEKDPLSISVDQLLRVLAALDASVVLQTADSGSAQSMAPLASLTATGATSSAVVKPGNTDNW